VTAVIFVSVGISVGTALVSVLGILLMGGPRLLTEIWNGTEDEPRLFMFGLFAIFIGGGSGAALAAFIWDVFVRKCAC
jgi:hypothetical protein